MNPNPSPQETVVDHLKALIRIPSVSHLSNRPVIAYAKATLEAAGWTAREHSWQDTNGIEKTNLIAAPPQQSPDNPVADLAFVCHTDTVPYSQVWPDALNPILRDGHLHGCGACDVKGFLACLLTAASSVTTHPQQTRIVLTADEEIGCLGAAHLLATHAIKARKIVIGEPTQLHVARAGKGYCLARVTVQGREAHSALPQHGASAIFAAARIITALEALATRLEKHQNPIFTPPCTTLNIGTIQGGTAKNIIPGRCEFLVEWRPIPGSSTSPATDLIAEAIKSIAAHHAALIGNVTCEVTILRQQSGFETNQTASLVQTIESLTSRPATSIPFGSEASLLSAIAEEIVVFGPGDMRTAHSDRECVPIAELEAATTIIKTLMSEQQ
jgi:acetylornithine deacetylase